MKSSEKVMTADRQARRGTGGRPTLEHAAALADKILACTWSIFVEQGYSRLNISAIARKAGVSHRTIYDRFGSKEGLFDAAVTHSIEQWGRDARDQMNNMGDSGRFELVVDEMFFLLRSPDVFALAGFLMTEGKNFTGDFRTGGPLTEAALNVFSERMARVTRNFPMGQEGLKLGGSVLALIHGQAIRSAAYQDVPEEFISRLHNDTWAIMASYGCIRPGA